MSLSSSPLLPIEPFLRLRVSDGLLLTAARWQQAHDYHRQRQNIHYQSLNQSGIVWGLGVRLTSSPQGVSEHYRDRRWVQIQPGIAIDHRGNPIVVPQAIDFRLASQPPLEGFFTIYLVIRYVDPDQLQGQSDRDVIAESFRIDELTRQPADTEVELCRIRLQPGEVELEPAADVLFPGINNLDLRDRRPAQAQAPATVRIAQIVQGQTDPTTLANLSYLVQALPALYPAIQATAVEQVGVQPAERLLHYDLLSLTYTQLLAWQQLDPIGLRQYLASGAVALVEMSSQEANIAELSAVRQQLQSAIASLDHQIEGSDIRRELETELTALEASLTQQLQTVVDTLQAIVQPVNPLTYSAGALHHQHLLRTHPFLFAQFPVIEATPTHLLNWGGIVLVIGSLSHAWGLDPNLSLPRETIRTAQELGINLLHFAWWRHHLTQLQQAT